MKRFLRILGYGLAAVLLVAAAAVGVTETAWRSHRARIHSVPPVDLRGVRGNARRGAYLFQIGAGCAECHGRDLSGGTVVENAMVGGIYGPNITPAALKDWTDGEIAAAIHHGVHRTGRGLFVMPSDSYQFMSREDVADLLAYVRSVRPLVRPNRDLRLSTFMKVLWAAGQVKNAFPVEVIEHGREWTPRVPEGPTRAYGAHLYKSHCAGCHREDGRGGKVESGPPDWPPASNLTVDGAGGWTQAEFIKAIRTGINPSGSAIRPPMGDAIRKFMSRTKEADLKALWEHLRTLPGTDEL